MEEGLTQLNYNRPNRIGEKKPSPNYCAAAFNTMGGPRRGPFTIRKTMRKPITDRDMPLGRENRRRGIKYYIVGTSLGQKYI